MRFTQKSNLPTLEFIQPIRIEMTSDEIIRIHKSQKAQDSDEHTNESWVIDCSDTEKLKQAFSKLGSKDKPGWFLYIPILETIMPSLQQYTRCSTESEEQTNSADTSSIVMAP